MESYGLLRGLIHNFCCNFKFSISYQRSHHKKFNLIQECMVFCSEILTLNRVLTDKIPFFLGGGGPTQFLINISD